MLLNKNEYTNLQRNLKALSKETPNVLFLIQDETRDALTLSVAFKSPCVLDIEELEEVLDRLKKAQTWATCAKIRQDKGVA